MVVNVLVEATATSGASGAARKPALPTGETCEELRQQLAGAIQACEEALGAQSQYVEPSIAINADQMMTCDPCSLVRLLPPAMPTCQAVGRYAVWYLHGINRHHEWPA